MDTPLQYKLGIIASGRWGTITFKCVPTRTPAGRSKNLFLFVLLLEMQLNSTLCFPYIQLMTALTWPTSLLTVQYLWDATQSKPCWLKKKQTSKTRVIRSRHTSQQHMRELLTIVMSSNKASWIHFHLLHMPLLTSHNIFPSCKQTQTIVFFSFSFYSTKYMKESNSFVCIGCYCAIKLMHTKLLGLQLTRAITQNTQIECWFSLNRCTQNCKATEFEYFVRIWCYCAVWY